MSLRKACWNFTTNTTGKKQIRLDDGLPLPRIASSKGCYGRRVSQEGKSADFSTA